VLVDDPRAALARKDHVLIEPLDHTVQSCSVVQKDRDRPSRFAQGVEEWMLEGRWLFAIFHWRDHIDGAARRVAH
jgi:hypothetical protein